MPIRKFAVAILFATAALLAVTSLSAYAEVSSPHQMIEQSIERITQRIEDERVRLQAEPGYAKQMVEEELGELVDFKRITRLVMAGHFSVASRDQKYRFLAVFRDSLIGAYSSGLTLYEGQKITVLPSQDGDVGDGRARVRTEVQTNAGKVIPIYFSLYQKKEGNWLVENVIVNGLNLGKTFRSQFDLSVQQYSGDLDQVIANWSSALDVGTPTSVAKAADEA